MIKQFSRGSKTVFMGTGRDLTEISEWTRSIFHLVYGPTDGEVLFRCIPARTVLSLWATRRDPSRPPHLN